MSLRNKVVFITGSSIGIGREDAYKFASEGSKLVITYHRDESDARSAADQCLRRGASDALVLRLNLMDNRSIKRAVDEAIGKFGYISILVNNAGVIAWKRLGEQSFADIEAQVRVNLEGLIKLTKECLPNVRDMIINMGSAASLAGYPDMIAYCASKWGVRGFTQALAKEAPHLKVYNVVSGGVATRMKDFQGIPPDKVAQVLLDFAQGRHELESGSDINVRDYLMQDSGSCSSGLTATALRLPRGPRRTPSAPFPSSPGQ